MNEQDLDNYFRQMLTKQASYAKFTEQAQRALLLADEEAMLLNHNYIGTEHLLLGLIHEGTGTAARVLKEFGIEIAAVRGVIEHLVGRGTPQPPDGERPLTPRTQVVIALAVSEGWRSPGHRIDTEHLLLGIIREGEGLAAAAIENLGVSLENVRTKVLQAIISQNLSTEPLKDIIRNKSNVVTCRIDGLDLDAIDALVEVGIRSTRSDAASWLIHAGVEANRAVLESVYATVAEIRQLRTRAQAAAQQFLKTSVSGVPSMSEEISSGGEGQRKTSD